MASPVGQPWVRYYLNEDDSYWTVAKVVAKQAAIAFAAICFCKLYVSLFCPGVFLGIALHRQLEEPFSDLHDIIGLSKKVGGISIPIFAILFGLGFIFAIPHSWALGSFSMGLWCGKRMVDLKNHCKGYV